MTSRSAEGYPRARFWCTAAVIAVLASGCASAAAPGSTDGASTATSAPPSASAAPESGEGSLKALCADTSEPGLSGDSAATQRQYLAWWNKVAVDAPDPIRQTAITIDTALKKTPDADRRLLDSYPSPFPDAALNKDVEDFDGWTVTHCPD